MRISSIANSVRQLQLAKKNMKNMKTKMDVFECHFLADDHVRLPSRSVSCMNISYLALRSLVLAVFDAFRDFVPMPMYCEFETPCTIPT